MKKYDVYGIGNALADKEFKVTAELLQELKIDKGVMTLVDEKRQQEIVEQLNSHPCQTACGGSAANTMVAISQMGGKGFYSCKIADDVTGSAYLEDLLKCGVATNSTQDNRPDGITGTCLVLVTPDADRTMNTFLGITADLSVEELVPEAIADSQYIYIEGYLVSSPTGRATAIKAKEIAEKAGVKTSLSLSDPNMVEFFKPGLLEMIGSGVDFLFANEAEAFKMADTQEIQGAIDYLKTIAKGFAITQGPQGSLIFDGEKIITIPAHEVTAIDTVGAGDMYAGAMLYGITQGMDFTQAGKLASLASAKIVTSYGPRLETAIVQGLLS